MLQFLLITLQKYNVYIHVYIYIFTNELRVYLRHIILFLPNLVPFKQTQRRQGDRVNLPPG